MAERTGITIHAVDGMVEIFRCYHGAPKAKTADGVEVGAMRGLFHTLVALLREADASHVAVAFDAVVDLVRFAGARGVGNAELTAQYPIAADIVRALGLVVWPMVRYQADDALATVAARFADDPRVARVVICSTDNDLTQCVRGTRVVLRNRIRKTELDEDGVRERFGVAPTSIPDYLALVGDKSDGLPGIPGWGATSAAALLAHYAHIEAIPDDPTAWVPRVRGAARLAGNLAERRREALLYRNLSRLHDDLPLPESLDDLAWPGAERERCEHLAHWLGVPEILERIPRWTDEES